MTTTTNPKFIEIAKQIEDLRDYGMFAKELSRGEVADAFEALLEIVVERASSAAGVEVLQAEVTDLRRQKSDLEVALAATMTAWHKDKAALESTVAALTEENAKTREAYRVAFASELGAGRARFASALDKTTAERDAATKRADLAEATLESVRAAVAKPVEDKQDGRPKVGDAVPWSEVEVGCLYRVAENSSYPFRVVTEHTTGLASLHVHDTTLEACLDGSYDGTTIEDLIHFHESAGGLLIARDLGTDPEAWRAAMREHSAKVGK